MIMLIVFLLLERYFFLMSPLEERKSEFKTAQLLLVSPVSYWISHLIFDLFILFAYAIICFSVSALVNEELANILKNNSSKYNYNRV